MHRELKSFTGLSGHILLDFFSFAIDQIVYHLVSQVTEIVDNS